MTSECNLHKCVIVMAAFVNMCLVGAHFSCFSLFYPAIADSFQTTLGITGWVGSLSQAMVYLPALAYSSLLTRYGCRVIAMIGSVLASLGYVTSIFTTSVPQLYVTYGLISGLGIGMVFLPTVVIVQQHFVNKRALASGLSLSGLSIGVVIMSAPMQYCITTFGWRGALLIYSGVCLNGLACSALFAPMKSISKAKGIRKLPSKTENQRKQYSSDLLEPLIHKTGSKQGSSQQYSSTETTSSHVTESEDNRVTRPNKTKILSLLKDTNLIFYSLGTFCMNVGMITFNMHTPNRSLKYGISPNVVAILPTTIALGNIMARIMFSFIANLACTDRTVQYALGIFLGGLISIGYSFTTTFWPICILCAGEGFFNGAAMTVQPTVLVDLFTVESLPRSHGVLNLFIGVASLLATPFAGFLYDVSRDYDIPFIVGGCIEILGFLAVLVVVFKRNKQTQTPPCKREPDVFVKLSS